MKSTILISLAALLATASASGFRSLVSPTLVRIEGDNYNGEHFATVSDIPVFSHVRAPVLLREHIPITRYSQEIVGGLSDSTNFATGNGIQLSETTRVVSGRGSYYEGERGELIKSESSLAKSGSYSYPGDDGIPIEMSWVADENGFRATGAHLPTPPPAPEVVAAPSAYGSSYGGYSAPAPVVVARIADYAAPMFRSQVY